MKNLRIINVKVIDNSNIDVTFTDTLTYNLTISNVSIIADTINVPNSQVLSIKVTGNTLSINCNTLSQLATYFLNFKSTPLHPFISLNGESRISEDGVTNVYLITAPLAPDNVIKNSFNSFYKDNIYGLDDDQTLVSKYINGLSIGLSKCLYDIGQIKNENYLSFTVTDEQKIRSKGAFDRLNEESAYQIIRVGLTPTGTNTNTSITFDPFPSFPITLQRQSNVETLTADSIDEVGKFNINNLTFNLTNSPVTKVTSIIFTFATANSSYTYNISNLGYQIKNSRYDQDYGFSYALLNENQIRISDKVLEDTTFALNSIIKVDIRYESKNLGKVIGSDSVSVYTSLLSSREVLPPIINIFSLKNAPIIDSSGNIPTINGVTFIDPNSNIPGSKHPAFVKEIPFRLNGLPTIPGQYSIDYANATIYVYGENSLNDGTGPFPPLATYNYKFTYKSDLDYIYDPDLLDIVSLPNGNLINFNGTVNFNYEQVLVPDIDYKANLHKEALAERVDNRLVALNALRTINSPITDAFRVYNETSGEIYQIDRFDDNKIYFKYNNPPRLAAQVGERVSFKNEINELLFVNTSYVNSNNLKIFKILLDNNTVTSSTEDSLASSFNTSLIFSNGNVFIKEKWYNKDHTSSQNINRLYNLGEYVVDYVNGIIYCAVSNSQSFDIGTATYKSNKISPIFGHLISVEDIYYRISVLNPKNKQFKYTSFAEGFIIPESLDSSDEIYLNGTIGSPYQLYNNSVGAFVNFTFVAGVTNQVKFTRSIYEYSDLLNSTYPLNFAHTSTSNGFNISVNSINKETFESVKNNGSYYYVNINENIPYLSPNITYTFSVIRTSDSAQLWNSSGTVVAGSTLKLILPGINSTTTGDFVKIVYSFTINNLSRIIVDYNKGDLFVDYTNVADEIIVSYEYGDNLLDFRESNSIPFDTAYYVSYKVGALREALLRNFATLINVPELSNFNIEFNRERYRDAIYAALSSFIQGPTLTAIKNIGKTISHIEPEVTESIFENWSLGNSILVPQTVNTTGEFNLLSAKYNNGVLINSADQSIKLPINSNIRLEEGTFETWLLPQWNGLDNDADLTFTILKDGYAINPYEVFIGAAEDHPVILNGTFGLNKNSKSIGTPNANKEGIFIYYDKDSSNSYYRWYVKVIDGYDRIDGYYDGYTDGYADGYAANYKITITTNGKFYDAKSIIIPKPSNMSMVTSVRSIKLTITGGLQINEGISFLSDLEHYILDFGKLKDQSRLSLFKDTSGYIVFKIFDKDKVSYSISSDVSSWKSNELHHVGISWKLNTLNNRDEMHLFIDGFEVPNIIKYGQKLQPYLHEKFRAINKEEVAGLASKDIVSSIDLITTSGSNIVSSVINFSALNITVGDTIHINETGFSSSGYLISSINGQQLVLNSIMPLTLSNGKFTINKTNFTVTSDIDIATNTAVYTIHPVISGVDLSTTINSSSVSSASTNFETRGVKAGYSISISNSLLEIIYTILSVSGNTLIITDQLPVTLSGATYRIYSNTENELYGTRALRPDYAISKEDVTYNNVLTLSNNTFAGDLIVIRTFGLNHRRIKQQNYIWSDNAENVLMTKLPPPISLDEVKITKIILPSTIINSSNATLISGIYYANTFSLYQPSVSVEGKKISFTISGLNVDFTVPVTITVNGNTGTEILTFTDYGTKTTLNNFNTISSINVSVKPINTSKTALVLEARESRSITTIDGYSDGYSDGYTSPVIRFSYHMGGNYTLKNDSSNSVRDENNLFSSLHVNNYLLIHSPSSVAGFYLITGISSDRHSLTVTPTNASSSLPLPSFTNGIYQILNVSEYRSGLQNGFFTFEQLTSPGVPYYLNKGFYELDYQTYARIKFDPLNDYIYFGSNFESARQANAILDQVKIYSIMLNDTRVGETIPSNKRSITKDFNSLKPLKVDSNTLALLDFNTFPFINSANFYSNINYNKQHFQSSIVINENFKNSVAILDKPIMFSNEGILDTKKAGTIEFWMNPIYDTSNDPNTRFYFDAFGAVVEDAISTNNVSVKIPALASSILSVKLKYGDQSIDYFAGGKLEIDTQNAIQEEGMSINNSSLIVSQSILQVISVKIEGDLTDTDYFANGSVGTDLKTIYLGKTLPQNSLSLITTYQTVENKKVKHNSQVIRLNRKLPYQNTPVIVNYIPKGLQGDRISIFKDIYGYMNFSVSASGIDYLLRAPTRWAKNTWHRVKASYKINGGLGTDEIRLFLDGYEFNNVLFGSGIVFGNNPIVMGSSMPGDGYNITGNIIFKDSINNLFIGSEYNGTKPIYSIIDNFRISNISRPIYAPYGESLDVNYSKNLSTAFPVTEDLFTTYLMDFDYISDLITDFAILKNRKSGLFDFSINIIDSLGIINSDTKIKEVLEKLIKVLKPANSRAFIKYK